MDPNLKTNNVIIDDQEYLEKNDTSNKWKKIKNVNNSNNDFEWWWLTHKNKFVIWLNSLGWPKNMSVSTKESTSIKGNSHEIKQR